MRENLLGYLMGALDEAERAEVQAVLESDPKLAAECARLEQTIAPLCADDEWLDPPGRLAERTTSLVAAFAEGSCPRQRAEDQQLPADERISSLEALIVDESDFANTDIPHRPQPASMSAVSLSPAGEELSLRRRRWTLADAIVALGICAAAAMLFFPAIANSRQQAAITQCQNNLRQLGHALVSYSRDDGGQFPLVPERGNMGVAGSYAPMLKESGRVTDDRLFLCPSSKLAQEASEFEIPASEDMLQKSGKPLAIAQAKMGGSYGYAFGFYNDDDQYCANLNRGRPRFAILADSPSLHLKNRQSANHGGCGQNVLFEDGHVEYLTRCCPPESADQFVATDNLFLSDRGYVEAGRHWNDTVIANSAARPVLPHRQ